jgi:hypothetical protein
LGEHAGSQTGVEFDEVGCMGAQQPRNDAKDHCHLCTMVMNATPGGFFGSTGIEFLLE